MWELKEAAAYYRTQGAPADQNALIAFLREAQQAHSGTIPRQLVAEAADELGIRESFLLAIIQRIPSLRLSEARVLELCAGPNCGKAAALASAAERLCAQKGVQLRYVGCMRMCGKGPNLKLDGTLHHKADEALLRRLLK